jgi:hypothetical protein
MFVKEILVDTDGQLKLVFSNTIKQFIFYLKTQILLTNTIQLCNLLMHTTNWIRPYNCYITCI